MLTDVIVFDSPYGRTSQDFTKAGIEFLHVMTDDLIAVIVQQGTTVSEWQGYDYNKIQEAVRIKQLSRYRM